MSEMKRKKYQIAAEIVIFDDCSSYINSKLVVWKSFNPTMICWFAHTGQIISPCVMWFILASKICHSSFSQTNTAFWLLNAVTSHGFLLFFVGCHLFAISGNLVCKSFFPLTTTLPAQHGHPVWPLVLLLGEANQLCPHLVHFHQTFLLQPNVILSGNKPSSLFLSQSQFCIKSTYSITNRFLFSIVSFVIKKNQTHPRWVRIWFYMLRARHLNIVFLSDAYKVDFATPKRFVGKFVFQLLE